MRASDFSYELPDELIAQVPAVARNQSRLMVVHRGNGRIEHRGFPDLQQYLQPGDVLVLNDSRVIRARLRGIKEVSGTPVEVLLLDENAVNDWWVMLRPGKRLRVENRIIFLDDARMPSPLRAQVVEKNREGECRLLFSGVRDVTDVLPSIGEVPLPPYIIRTTAVPPVNDAERYQTVYARAPGSIAAPTAGLHFTEAHLDQIRARGVAVEFVTLHVGAGTFAPVKTDDVEAHVMHEERFQLDAATAQSINEAKRSRRRVIAVGTTTVRVLESIAGEHDGELLATEGRTRIFIRPPFRFQVVDGLLTNFHLPRSTLLMLACAFAAPGEARGTNLILRAYAEAIRQRYRFYSYGDAMLIV